jgi:hypothetical protein
MGGPATPEVESGVTTVSASGGGATAVAGTFLWRSGRDGGGGMVGVGFCGKISSSIGGAAAVVRIRVFAAISKPVSTATCSARTASNATIRGRSHRCHSCDTITLKQVASAETKHSPEKHGEYQAGEHSRAPRRRWLVYFVCDRTTNAW